jgi:hypothetical protein
MSQKLTENAFYPAAAQRPVPGWEHTGTLTDTENLKLVWHKTQGNSDPYEWYKISGGIPDLTLQRDGTMHQHYRLDRFSRALKNLRGGIETNRDGVIQCEVVGYVGQEATDAQLNAIVDLIIWCEETLDIPTTWPLGRPRGAADHGRHRDSVFDDNSGQFGHSQVGEQDHIDPNWTDREWSFIEAGTVPSSEGVFMPDLKLDSRAVYKKLGSMKDYHTDPLVGVWQEYLRDAQPGGPYYTARVDSIKGPKTRAAHAAFEAEAFPNAKFYSDKPGRKSWSTLRSWAQGGRAADALSAKVRRSKIIDLLDQVKDLIR